MFQPKLLAMGDLLRLILRGVIVLGSERKRCCQVIQFTLLDFFLRAFSAHRDPLAWTLPMHLQEMGQKSGSSARVRFAVSLDGFLSVSLCVSVG